MNIDINTKFITLIGTPLGQSFAARMQNKAYAAMGKDIHYFYTEVDDRHIGEIVKGIKYMPSFLGAAVTKPNKVRVLAYLDRLAPLCQKMGASNTIVKEKNGDLVGYNTDGAGFYKAITAEGGYVIEGNSAFVFGAGGAGRAIASVLAYHKADRIYITDAIEESARSLAEIINANIRPVAKYVPLGEFEHLKDSDLIVNATGIGMGKTKGKTPMPPELIEKDKFYFDACYNPDKTQFLINAESEGCQIMNGLAMSLYQGVRQIELWTGEDAPVEVMRQELLDIIAEQNAQQNKEGDEH